MFEALAPEFFETEGGDGAATTPLLGAVELCELFLFAGVFALTLFKELSSVLLLLLL